MTCCFSKFMYLYWFRPYRGGEGIIRLLDTKSDELKPVFLWYDGKMMIAINCNWIQISIVSWIRDILVRIRIRRSVPFTYGSKFILGSGSRSMIFWSGSADPNHYNWIQIIIVLWIRDILVRIRRSEPLTQGSGSILGFGSGSVIFWSGSADLNHWLKDLDLYQY